MPDWSEEIRRRVAPSRLDPGREADVVGELAQHLEDRYLEARAGGASEDAACGAALAELASSDFVRDLQATGAGRQADPIVPGAPRGGALAADLWQDVRFGLRLMRKAPGFTAVAAVTLAVGIGANTAMFTVVSAAMLRPLPFADPDRLVRLAKAWRFYDQLIADIGALPGVQAVAATSAVPLARSGNGASEVSVPGRPGVEDQGSAGYCIVSPGYFETMGIRLRGREFTARDTRDGESHVIVSEAMVRRYWPDEDPIGKRS
jgi:hypothetical protein